jgi:outer membrane lipoprotein LolB
MRLVLSAVCCLFVAACATRAPVPVSSPSHDWETRSQELQGAGRWQLNGRAAVAYGTQGWQAALDWHQEGAGAELHLAGPLGIGAQVIKQSPQGLSLNGAPPSSTALKQLQDTLGFELPLSNLRYWLLGVPDPRDGFDLQRNAQDRAQHLAQDGWNVDYERYMPVAGDVLPARIVLTRAGVRVRIVADHWDLKP